MKGSETYPGLSSVLATTSWDVGLGSPDADIGTSGINDECVYSH